MKNNLSIPVTWDYPLKRVRHMCFHGEMLILSIPVTWDYPLKQAIINAVTIISAIILSIPVTWDYPLKLLWGMFLRAESRLAFNSRYLGLSFEANRLHEYGWSYEFCFQFPLLGIIL